jgi:hypothetical protein
MSMAPAGEAASGELRWRAAGEGTWGGAGTNWLDGTRAVAWTDGSAARFDGPGGRVTLAAPVTASGIRSGKGGYVIQTGRHPLILTGDVDASVRLAVAKPQEDKNVGLGRPAVLTGSLIRFEGKAEEVRHFRGELVQPSGTVMAVDGCTLLFDGRADFPHGFLRVLLERGARLRIGANAWINNYTGADQNTREMVVHGDPQRPGECVFEIDAGFRADNCGFDPDAGQHGWAPHGYCQLSMRDVTFVTHSSRSLPGMLKRYRGALIADAEINAMGRCTWIVDTAHQFYRGTLRSWNHLTIDTRTDLTVMADERIPNSRFGDRHITKRGPGTLHIAGRQFFYTQAAHDGAPPMFRIEEGVVIMRTNPCDVSTAEGMSGVPPEVHIGREGKLELLASATVGALECVGALHLGRVKDALRVLGKCDLKETAVMTCSPDSSVLTKTDAVMVTVEGDLTLAGTLCIAGSRFAAGSYRLFKVSGVMTGAFERIVAPDGFEANVQGDHLVLREIGALKAK